MPPQEYFFPKEDDRVSKRAKGEGKWARARGLRARASSGALPDALDAGAVQIVKSDTAGASRINSASLLSADRHGMPNMYL